MIICNLILLAIGAICSFIISDTNDSKLFDDDSNVIDNSNQIIIPNSLKIELNNRNVKNKDLFKLIFNDYFSFKSLFYSQVAQGIMSWLTEMERNIKDDDEFEEIMNTIRPIIEIIKGKITKSIQSFSFKFNFKNDILIKLLILFDYSNDSNSFINSIIREFYDFHSDNESFKLISNSNSCNYDPLRVQVISTLIAPFNHKRVAIDLSKIIGEYDQNEALKCVYEKVMNNLKLSKKEKSNLDFYSSTFVKDLALFMGNISFNEYDSLWYNLQNLLFKWMIYQREQNASIEKDENGFNESLNDIKLIAFIIKSKTGTDFLVNFNLKSMNSHDFNIFKSLIQCEFLENRHLFDSLADSIKNFHDDIRGKRMKIKIACEILKIKYFNGHFDSNIRLKYLILSYNPIREMRDCILRNDPQSKYYSKYFPNLPNKEITEEYLMDLRIKEPKNLLMNLFYNRIHLNKFILEESLQANNQKFRIKDNIDIFYILDMMNREDLLTWENIKNLVEFPSINQSLLGWNQKEFDENIEYLKKNLVFKNDLIDLDEFLKKLGPRSLFDQKPYSIP